MERKLFIQSLDGKSSDFRKTRRTFRIGLNFEIIPNKEQMKRLEYLIKHKHSLNQKELLEIIKMQPLLRINRKGY